MLCFAARGIRRKTQQRRCLQENYGIGLIVRDRDLPRGCARRSFNRSIEPLVSERLIRARPRAAAELESCAPAAADSFRPMRRDELKGFQLKVRRASS